MLSLSMRRIILLLVFILQVFSSGWAKESLDPNASQVEFLISYPRSGTNLLTGYIQNLTGKPISVAAGTISELAMNRLAVPINASKKPLYRAHHAHEIQGWNKNGNKLICIIRNYKECITREHQRKSISKLLDKIERGDPTAEHYIDNLRVFDAWDKDNRLLIYYEDLISKPDEEIKKVLTFLRESVPTNLSKESLQDTSQKILSSYHTQHISSGGSHSKGKDLLYHSKQMTLKQLKRWDELISKKDPELWERYLKRYKTSE